MDSIQAQLQIRQNALEAQEYAQDLLSWQKTLNAKSSSSNSNSSKQHGQQQHPQLPVRGRAGGSVAAASKTAQQPALRPQSAGQSAAQRQAHPAAHTYKNYDKWDRFDVDAALEATEAEASSSKAALPKPRPAPVRSSRDQQQDQEAMIQPRVANAPAAAQTPANKAAALKDQGNKLFQAKYFEEAISCYTQSIDIYPTAVAYANRAMAYLKLDKFPEAEADCTAALQLDPLYVKAWHRRATARRQLSKHLEAAADFEEVLRLELSNAAVQADRNQALDQHLKQQAIQRSTAWHSVPVKAQPVADTQSQQQQPQQVQPETSLQQLQQQQAAQQQAADAAPAKNGLARPVTPVTPSGRSSKSGSAQVSPQQRQSVAAAAQAAAEQLAARLASSLKPPKTGHEFESAWRSLKGDVQLQGKYLRLLQPQHLPTLFKSSLTAQLLSTLLTAALTAMAQPAAANADISPAAPSAAGSDAGATQQLSADHAVGLMEGLVKVPRFDMMVMSLGSRDKAALRQLWEAAAAAADSSLQERMAAVRAKYRL